MVPFTYHHAVIYIYGHAANLHTWACCKFTYMAMLQLYTYMAILQIFIYFTYKVMLQIYILVKNTAKKCFFSLKFSKFALPRIRKMFRMERASRCR